MWDLMPSTLTFSVHHVGERLKALIDAGLNEDTALEWLSRAPLLYCWDSERVLSL